MSDIEWHEGKNHGLKADKIIIKAKAIDAPTPISGAGEVQTVARVEAQAWVDEAYTRGRQLKRPVFTGQR